MNDKRETSVDFVQNQKNWQYRIPDIDLRNWLEICSPYGRHTYEQLAREKKSPHGSRADISHIVLGQNATLKGKFLGSLTQEINACYSENTDQSKCHKHIF